MKPTACQDCPAEVIFVPSATSGRPMILDAKPEKRVVVECFDGDEWQDVNVARYREHPEDYPIPPAREPQLRARVIDAFVDHHATCPAAQSWKGRTRGR